MCCAWECLRALASNYYIAPSIPNPLGPACLLVVPFPSTSFPLSFRPSLMPPPSLPLFLSSFSPPPSLPPSVSTSFTPSLSSPHTSFMPPSFPNINFCTVRMWSSLMQNISRMIGVCSRTWVAGGASFVEGGRDSSRSGQNTGLNYIHGFGER